MPEKIFTTRPWTQHPLSPGKLYRQQRADIKTPVINTYAKQVRLLISVRNECVCCFFFFFICINLCFVPWSSGTNYCTNTTTFKVQTN